MDYVNFTETKMMVAFIDKGKIKACFHIEEYSEVNSAVEALINDYSAYPEEIYIIRYNIESATTVMFAPGDIIYEARHEKSAN